MPFLKEMAERRPAEGDRPRDQQKIATPERNGGATASPKGLDGATNKN
jgi:hypothetical protein